jgi:hypothetical protein
VINAIYAATGKRIRQLPIDPALLTRAGAERALPPAAMTAAGCALRPCCRRIGRCASLLHCAPHHRRRADFVLRVGLDGDQGTPRNLLSNGPHQLEGPVCHSARTRGARCSVLTGAGKT